MVFQTASLIQHWYRSCWDVIGWAVGLLRLCSCVQGSLLWDIWLVLGRNLQQMLSWPFQDTSKEEHLLTLPRNIMQMRTYKESSGEAPALSSHGISQESVYQANLQLLQSVCCASIWLLWPCQHWVCPAHLRDSCMKERTAFLQGKAGWYTWLYNSGLCWEHQERNRWGMLLLIDSVCHNLIRLLDNENTNIYW